MVFTNASFANAPNTHRSTVELVLHRLRTEPGVLVQVTSTQGSVPREAGAWMMVFSADVAGTIGGGHLEFDAIEKARARLASPAAEPDRTRVALGPSLGQCCGGVVHLVFEDAAEKDIQALGQRLRPASTPVALFGGGHVGHAIAHVLAPLPFALT